MTSNLGSQELLEAKKTTKEEILSIVEPILKRHFRPEFLNRLDDILPFLPLQEKDMEAIVLLQLKSVRSRLEQRDIHLEWSKSVVTYLAEKGYDPLYGARPLKRLIQNEVVNTLSSAILKGDIAPHQTIHLEMKNKESITYRM